MGGGEFGEDGRLIHQSGEISVKIPPCLATGFLRTAGDTDAGALLGEARQGLQRLMIQPVDVDVQHIKDRIAATQASAFYRCILQERRRHPERMVAQQMGRSSRFLELPVIGAGRCLPVLRQLVQHSHVFDRQVYRHIRIRSTGFHVSTYCFHVLIERYELIDKRAVRPQMGCRIECVVAAGRVVRHAVPEYVIDAVGENGIGQQLQVLNALLPVVR